MSGAAHGSVQSGVQLPISQFSNEPNKPRPKEFSQRHPSNGLIRSRSDVSFPK
jgi:hypothetical protein